MRRLFFILGLLLATNAIVAQTNYYTESKLFQENGYTYKVNYPPFVELYNAGNKWIGKEPTYKDTGEFFDSENTDLNSPLIAVEIKQYNYAIL